MQSNLVNVFFYNFFSPSENCSLFAVPTLVVVFQRLHKEMSVKIGAHVGDLSAIVVELAYPRVRVLRSTAARHCSESTVTATNSEGYRHSAYTC